MINKVVPANSGEVIMQIFIMRHGQAAQNARSDTSRPLTENGCHEILKMSVCLQQHLAIPIERVLVSPYLRAQQTLAVLGEKLALPHHVEILDMLTPEGDAKWNASYLAALSEQGIQAVLVISHLPLVGYLVSELCPSMEMSPMFSPAAIATISFHRGRGELLWQLSPAQL